MKKYLVHYEVIVEVEADCERNAKAEAYDILLQSGDCIGIYHMETEETEKGE